MADYLEAFVSLLPSDAGGRAREVAPRDGSYRPFARTIDDDGERPLLRIRFIEGPPRLVPGDGGRVVVELETPAALVAGHELDLIEHDRVVGALTVLRSWR